MMDQILERYLRKQNIDYTAAGFVLGISGGADSVALLYAFAALRGRCGDGQEQPRLYCVHLNHHMRPDEESVRDQEYTKALCKQLRVEYLLFSEDIPALAKDMGIGEEEAGRIRRYQIFEQIRAEREAVLDGLPTYIVTAHHRDDDNETVLLNLLRGSGLRGMAGMQPFDRKRRLLRPFLDVHKEALMEYLRQHEVVWMEDATNSSSEASRNRIRNQVLPKLTECFGKEAADAFTANKEIFSQTDDYMIQQAEAYLEQHGRPVPLAGSCQMQLYCLDAANFGALHPALQDYVVRSCIKKVSPLNLHNVSAAQTKGVSALASQRVGTVCELGNGCIARRTYEHIFIGREAALKQYIEEKGMEEYVIGKPEHYRLIVEPIMPEALNHKEYCAENACAQYVDYGKIKGKPILRNRQPQDRFCISSSGASKKLKDVLIDLKVPKEYRDQLLLLAVEHEVIWIVGVRLSPAYFITEQTTTGAKLQVKEYQ